SAAAPALDRLLRWVKEAKLRGAEEMWQFALSNGEFEPAVLAEDGLEVVTPAKLSPPGRGGPAFCEAVAEAADQCVEVLVNELGFVVPEIPQASLSGSRRAGKDRRDAESEGEAGDEEDADADLFGEEEEDAGKSRKVKKAKQAEDEPSPADLAVDEALKRRVDAWLGARVSGYEPAKGENSEFALRERASVKLRRKVVADPVTGEMKSVAVPRLSKDQFLEQNFEMVEKISDLKERALFRKYIGWILTLTEKFSWADVYDFDAQVRDDFAQGRVTSWDPVPLAFRFQYSFADSLGDAQKRLTDDRGSKKSNPRDSKTREKKRDGLPEAAPLDLDLTAAKVRGDGKAKKERKWSAKFLAMFTAVGVSLASYGVPEADWLQYQQDVVAVGARVSPLTERADRWAQAAWGLPGAEEVVRGVATGFRWQQEQPAEFFEVENYVPLEHQDKVRRKLQEEEDAGRMVRTDAGSVPSISALGIVFRVVEDSEAACQQGFELLLELVEFLGFEVAPEKVESPRQDIVFLGVRLQSNQSGLGVVAMSIDESRVQRVAAECRHVAGLQKVRVKEVERLVGQLMFCARVVYGAKMFLRSGYDFLGRARRMRRVFDSVPEGLSKDLRWLAKMLDTNNGQAVVLNKRPVVRDFFAVDAAGEEAVDGGMGGFFGGRWFSVKWEEVKRWRVLPFSPFRDEASSHINYLELFVIFWALKLWGHLLRGCKIVLWSDNESARLMTENLWGKATFIPLLKEILLLTVKHDLRIVTRRISSKANGLADALSRSEMSRFFELLRAWSRRDAPRDLDDWMVNEWLWDKARVFGPFAVDACCDEMGANSRCFSWWSMVDSCLSKQWRGLNVYCNPPFSLLLEILTHFLSEKRVAPRTTSALFVLPFWPTERFWLEIVVPAIDCGLFQATPGMLGELGAG
ncbi:hypothetical protein CYMTET_7392, partial [Cymbomonas tetramitiformis]